MRLKIDWVSLVLGRTFTVFLCFTLHLRAISKYKAPLGAYIWSGDLTEGFLRYEFGGLIFGGVIHGGACFRNFTGYKISASPQRQIDERFPVVDMDQYNNNF